MFFAKIHAQNNTGICLVGGLGNVTIPADELIFVRGLETTNQYIYILYINSIDIIYIYIIYIHIPLN